MARLAARLKACPDEELEFSHRLFRRRLPGDHPSQCSDVSGATRRRTRGRDSRRRSAPPSVLRWPREERNCSVLSLRAVPSEKGRYNSVLLGANGELKEDRKSTRLNSSH